MITTVDTSHNRRQPIQLFLDFDGTLTDRDTLHLVSATGYKVQKRNNRSPPPTPWQDIVKAYLDDYEAHARSYIPAKGLRVSIQQEIEWLRSLQTVEEASAQRVFAAGVFDNVEHVDVVGAASDALALKQVHLRKGWNDLFSYVHDHHCQTQSIDRNKMPITILSVNWSATFVQCLLQKACAMAQHVDFDMEDRQPRHNPGSLWTEHLQVFANEIPSVQATSPSPENAVPMRTSGDKVQIFNKVRAVMRNPSGHTMYIADSTTDLECLLAADTGISIRDEPMGSGQQDLVDTCKRVGIEVYHISHKTDLIKTPGTLWWARDFVEIRKWLEALDNT